MPSRIGGKIHGITKLVRRIQTFCATTSAVTLGSITTLFFLPVSVSVRLVLFVPGLIFFSRKIYMFVYARQAWERLEFEEQFLKTGADSSNLLESLSVRSKLWNRSAIVRSVHGADYRPQLDRTPENVLLKRLELHLKRNFSQSLLPRPGFDILLLVLWIATWVYAAILHPGPSVVSATVLLMSGLILFISLSWLELGVSIALREQRHRMFAMYWDLAEWLIEQFADLNANRTREAGYLRTEHFRDSPWFSGKRSDGRKTDAGGLT